MAAINQRGLVALTSSRVKKVDMVTAQKDGLSKVWAGSHLFHVYC
jgi:hypothetical protein